VIDAADRPVSPLRQELWEITCAVEEQKPLLGLWIEDGYRTKPAEMGRAPCKIWTWVNVEQFIDGL